MSILRSWTGRELHRRGPAAAKDLSPSLLSVRGTTQVGTLADRSRRRVLSDTGSSPLPSREVPAWTATGDPDMPL